MMLYTENRVQGQAGTHVVEIVDGCLFIDGVQKTFRPSDTEQFLDILLIWWYGLEKVSLDSLADSELDA